MNASLNPLFRPLSVRNLSLPNRAVMAPMGRGAAIDGAPGEDLAAYYARRAKGGAGLILGEATAVDHPLASDHPGVPLLHGDAAIAGWKRVVDAVHAEGGRIIPELFHLGPLRGGVVGDASLPNLRPSGLFGTPGPHSMDPAYVEKAQEPTAPMTDADIADVIAAFARSAANAVAIGFDGIEIHGAHGFLIDAFLWEASNSRSDGFGGDPRRRAAFAVEIIRAVRAEMPQDMPLLFRFSQHKSQNYAARVAETPQDLEAMLGPLADAGVDIFDASTRRFWEPAFEGSPLTLAGWAKYLTGRPSIAVGSVGLDAEGEGGRLSREETVETLMTLLDRDEFDLINIGRSMIGDPDFVRKLEKGEMATPFSPEALATLL